MNGALRLIFGTLYPGGLPPRVAERLERPSGARIEGRVREAFKTEEYAGLRLAIMGRTVALCAIAVLLVFVVGFPAVLYYHVLIALFISAGFVQIWAFYKPWRRVWHGFAVVAAEFAFMGFTLLNQNPLERKAFPDQIALHFDNVVYMHVLLVALAFSFRPRLVLWGGFVAAASWASGVAWLATRPEAKVIYMMDDDDTAAVLDAMTSPTTVDLGVAFQNVVLLLIMAALLSMIVARSRGLALQQALVERDRSNLARYFPPATVERLARRDRSLEEVREQRAAVLFVDLRGFTAWSERHTSSDVIALLRNMHARLEEAVFEHQGTLDKFIGDGLMATFGTPDPGPRDASRALKCLRQILTDFENGVAPSADHPESGLILSAGLHYGPVVIGDIGTERRMEFAVLGDTVNVASRLETETRTLNVRAAVSEALVDAVRRESPEEADGLLGGFEARGPQMLKGRANPVPVWTAL